MLQHNKIFQDRYITIMIKVTNLNKYYHKTKAVSNLSFHIKAGELIGFIGPNGAGKTTTLKCLATLTLPDSGEIIIDNIDAIKEPGKTRSLLGFLPENTPLIDELTVNEYLKYRLTLKNNGSKQERNVYECIKICDLLDVQDKIIAKLSKGYRQRVGIAETLLGSPKLLLLDEPINGLDPDQIIKIRELLVSLKNKVSIIISSHILSELELICDRYLIITNGCLKTFGTQEEIIDSSSRLLKTTIELSNKDDQIIKQLKELPHIESVEYIKNKITIFHNKINSDTSFSISHILKNSSAHILQITPHKPNLETLYLELTSE